MEEVRRTRKGIDYIAKVLKVKKTIATRAVFWRIPHKTEQDSISLKLGRYRRTEAGEEIDVGSPKSELTLDDDEFRELADFLASHYEPLREGARKFVVLDSDLSAVQVEQMRSLFGDPDREKVVDFLLANDVLQEDLLHALDYRRKANAVHELEKMLARDLVESNWQRFFEQHDWILGSDFVRVLDEREIDVDHIADYLMQAYDGFLDLIEIKRPEGSMQFWASTLDHGHYVPHSDLTKAITQAQRYIYEVEREANSLKTLERLGGVKAVKPRCTLIFGRSNDWTLEQTEAYRILNAGLHSLSILTYDHVLERARRMLSIPAAPAADAGVDDDIPF
jgi:antiviral defense system Shedu protein SduA